MFARSTRLWFLTGLVHLALGLALGLATAAPTPGLTGFPHAILLVTAVAFMAGAILHGLTPAFAQRDADLPWLAIVPILLVVLGDGLWLARQISGAPLLSALAAPHALAWLAISAHAIVLRFVGTPWASPVDLFDASQPHRKGDYGAAVALGAGALGLAVGAILLLVAPRGLPSSGLFVALSAGILPMAYGGLAFVLPREVGARLDGVTLIIAGLVLLDLAVLFLTIGLIRPGAFDLRAPAAALLLAFWLAGHALIRTRLPAKLTPRLYTARGLLRLLIGVALLAGLAHFFAVFGGAPSTLLAMAFYASLVLAFGLTAAGLVIGARLLLPGEARVGRWAVVATMLAILGLWILTPYFVIGRSAFPGAVLLSAAGLVALRGLWPLAQPALGLDDHRTRQARRRHARD